jgi:alpha-glucosidase
VSAPVPRDAARWWHDAVIYQVYLRSFADGTGEGIGDLAGLRSRLPYLRDLGIDAICATPWYPSPSPTAATTSATTAGPDPRRRSPLPRPR